MSEREALAAALETFQGPQDPALDLLIALGHRILVQLPEPCGTCEGEGQVSYLDPIETAFQTCPSCHGRGTVYKAETVALVMSAGITLEKAVAVLDALNSEPL